MIDLTKEYLQHSDRLHLDDGSFGPGEADFVACDDGVGEAGFPCDVHHRSDVDVVVVAAVGNEVAVVVAGSIDHRPAGD